MGSDGDAHRLKALLAEQLTYYRARAPEYSQTAFSAAVRHELLVLEAAVSRRVEAFARGRDALELAGGPGTWTGLLAQNAGSVTAVDGAPEMLALAREKVTAPHVRFIRADLFDWRPDRSYEGVFFGFWLSHVPLERFAAFWSMVAAALTPDGRALSNGKAYRAVKVPHTPEDLEARLRRLGWNVTVNAAGGPFYWGSATRR